MSRRDDMARSRYCSAEVVEGEAWAEVVGELVMVSRVPVVGVRISQGGFETSGLTIVAARSLLPEPVTRLIWFPEGMEGAPPRGVIYGGKFSAELYRLLQFLCN